MQVRPMVGIADRRVKSGQLITMRRYLLIETPEIADDLLGSNHHVCHFYIPQRSAGVCTGASQSRTSSSSSFNRVIEHPAISSEVI